MYHLQNGRIVAYLLIIKGMVLQLTTIKRIILTIIRVKKEYTDEDKSGCFRF